MPNLVMRFDMRNPEFGADKTELYAAALDMAQWADEQGFDVVQISEHHGSEDSYLPSPLVLAAAMAARTRHIRLRFSLIILPLNDPIKLAEDLAVLDIISNGRVEVIFGAGYVPHEFEMFGVDTAERAGLMEEGISAIKQAWSGEPFDYRGRRVMVRPTPLQQPHPPIWMGGSSPAAARRAGRLVSNFYVPSADLYEVFRQSAIEHQGFDPGPWADIGTGFLVVADDPDKEWQRLEPYILHECNSYSRWQQEGKAGGQYQAMTDVSPLRESGLYPVLTPEQALEYARERGADGNICLHPLISGFPPAWGWEQLQRFADTVLPQVRAGRQ